MAHGPDCEDFDIRDQVDPLRWFPQGTPADVDLTTLPAPGAISKPIRLPGARAPWVGVWGSFAGLRIGTSAGGPTWPVDKGTTFVYPGSDLDLYASADSGAWGKATLGRFWKREYAVSWAGVGSLLRSGSGAPFGPFPAATIVPTQNDPLPTTTRIGSVNQLYNATAAKLDLWRGEGWNADGAGVPVWGIGNVQSWNQVLSDRTGSNSQLRQPNSTAPKSILQSAISLASTGVKATRTMAQDGFIRFAVVSPLSGTPTNAVVGLQIVRTATTFLVGSTGQLSAALNVSYPVAFTTSSTSPWMGIPVVASDVVQINVLTAAGAAAAGDFSIGFEENRNNV